MRKKRTLRPVIEAVKIERKDENKGIYGFPDHLGVEKRLPA